MQKKLLSLAIAGALAVPGAAMADVQSQSGGNVTIYGKFHASWDYVDNDANSVEANKRPNGDGTYNDVIGSGDDGDDNTAVFRNSRLGFKGTEKLGYGLEGVWQVETHLNTGENNVALRNTFVGLRSNTWGEIRFGKHDTPYKSSTAKLDIFSDTIADYNNILGVHMVPGQTYGRIGENDEGKEGTKDVIPVSNGAEDAYGKPIYYPAMNFNERESNLMMYITPSFLKKKYGVEARFARESFSIDEENTFIDGTHHTTGYDDEWEAFSASGVYEKGPLFVSLAYELFRGHGNHNATGDHDIDAWKAGFGYTLGNSKISFIYEDIDSDGDDDDQAFDVGRLDADGNPDHMKYGAMSRDAFYVNFSHKFGANVVKMAYGKADDSDVDSADDGADNWSIGIDHNFSKRTKVYAIYSMMDNDQDGNYGLYAPHNKGATMRDGNFYTGGNGAGDDVSSVSLGIIHKF